jgi:outer membrane protein assembly factor BamB
MVVAMDAQTGSVKWRRELTKQYKAEQPKWGYCQSLLVYNGKVYVDPGGESGHALMAFDAKTGEVAWHTGSYKAGYSSPVATKLAGIDQVLFFTGKGVISTASKSGKILWEIPWETSYDVSAATPLIIDDKRFFISSGYGTGSALFQLDTADGKPTPKVVWKEKTMKNKMSTSVRIGDHLYGFDEARLAAVSLNTGEKRWSQPGFDRGSLIGAGEQLFVLGEECTLALVEASPKGYVERGRKKILGELCWTVPSLSQGRLFVRDIKHIMSLDVAAKPRR